jgi:hypothetical protein
MVYAPTRWRGAPLGLLEAGARRGGEGALRDELPDESLAGARTKEEITGNGGLLSQLTKRLVDRALEVELTDHLGYLPHQEPSGGAGNTRNAWRDVDVAREPGRPSTWHCSLWSVCVIAGSTRTQATNLGHANHPGASSYSISGTKDLRRVPRDLTFLAGSSAHQGRIRHP